MTVPGVFQILPPLRSSRRRGLTLIDATISIVIVGVLVVSALQATGAVARSRVIQQDRAQAMALARTLMSEVTQESYVDPDGGLVLSPEVGETRTTYDDVDDYNGLNQSPPRDRNNAILSDFSSWRWQAAVSYMDASLLNVVLGSDTGIKRITVTVTSPTGKLTTLQAIRSSVSAYEKNLTGETTFVASSTVTLQVGSSSRTKIVSSANALNQIP